MSLYILTKTHAQINRESSIVFYLIKSKKAPQVSILSSILLVPSCTYSVVGKPVALLGFGCLSPEESFGRLNPDAEPSTRQKTRADRKGPKKGSRQLLDGCLADPKAELDVHRVRQDIHCVFKIDWGQPERFDVLQFLSQDIADDALEELSKVLPRTLEPVIVRL